MWLAWWMVHEDNHSTLRASADRVSRRADVFGMGVAPNPKAFGGPMAADFTASGFAKNLKS